MQNANPFLTMLSDTLPSGQDPRSPRVVAMLGEVPPAVWNGYNLAATPEGRAGGLEALRVWVSKFGLALL